MTAGPHDHGSRDDRAACRCDPDLIDAHDADDALVPESALVAKGRDDRSHRPIAYRNRTTPPVGGVGVVVA
jgi:hypothetical protein